MLQAVETSRENPCLFDKSTSGRTIYAYTNNDPLNNVDPLGLCDNPQGCGGGTSNQVIPSAAGTGSGTQTVATTADSTTAILSEVLQAGNANLIQMLGQSSDIAAVSAAIGLTAGPLPPASVNIQLAAGGFECQGLGSAGCQSGGSFGTTGMFVGGGRVLCQNCIIIYTGTEGLPAREQLQIITPFQRQRPQ